MTKAEEIKIKLQRVEDYIKVKKAKALLLSKIPYVAWLTCGSQMHVNTATETSVATVLVKKGAVRLLTTNIEAKRLFREEMKCLPIPLEPIMWYEDKAAWVRKQAGGGTILSDIELPDTSPLPGDFMKLTYELTYGEIRRYELLGRDVGGALERAARAVKPGMSENAIAGLIAAECYAIGAQPVVVLVAADDRITNFRHPIPTALRLQKTAMLVVCGRRNGLIVSATRMVHFGKLSKTLRRKHDAVVRIDAYFDLTTRPGVKVADIFNGAREVYAKTGFKDEWTLHHQGGGTGYFTRDFIATPTTKEVVCENQAFAWNPSITGTKSEDTIITLKRQNKVLSLGADWPSIEVEVDGDRILRPDILVR